MTEQEYMNVSDLQLFRAALDVLRLANAFSGENQKILGKVRVDIMHMIKNLKKDIKLK